MKRVVALTVVVFLACAPAHAYLDPGTGSMLLQGLLAAIAVASAAVAAFWTRIVQLFRGRHRPGRSAEGDRGSERP